MSRRLLVSGLVLLVLTPVLANDDPPAEEGKQKTDGLAKPTTEKTAGKYEFLSATADPKASR